MEPGPADQRDGISDDSRAQEQLGSKRRLRVDADLGRPNRRKWENSYSRRIPRILRSSLLQYLPQYIERSADRASKYSHRNDRGGESLVCKSARACQSHAIGTVSDDGSI